MARSAYADIVALTGTIGAGKTTASAIFRELGASVVDADAIVHRLLSEDAAVIAAIRTHFGASVVGAAGALDHASLAKSVFNDPAHRKVLEKIVHPRVAAEALKEFSAALASLSPLVIYDVPLFFEAGLDQEGYRAVILLVADDELCIERLMQRGGLSRGEALKRLAAQMPIAEKKRRADFIIENQGTIEELQHKIQQLYVQLTQLKSCSS